MKRDHAQGESHHMIPVWSVPGENAPFSHPEKAFFQAGKAVCHMRTDACQKNLPPLPASGRHPHPVTVSAL
jgi:hypothetical protein